MKRQIVVLEIEYDPNEDGFTTMSPAAEWDWVTLVGDHDVVVLAAGPEVNVPEGAPGMRA